MSAGPECDGPECDAHRGTRRHRESERTRREHERLFLALWPGAAVRRVLAGLAREHLPRVGRPVHAANLHLTLVFLGAVETGARARLEEACAEIAFAPFTLTLSRLGCWARAGVAWSAPERTPEALAALVEGLRAAAARAEIAAEARPFRAHVTLARRLGARAGKELPAEHRPVRWEAREFVLVRSRTDPRGARYEVLRAWPGEA